MINKKYQEFKLVKYKDMRNFNSQHSWKSEVF